MFVAIAKIKYMYSIVYAKNFVLFEVRVLLITTEFVFKFWISGIFFILRSTGVDSKESIPPAYGAWRGGSVRRLF